MTSFALASGDVCRRSWSELLVFWPQRLSGAAQLAEPVDNVGLSGPGRPSEAAKALRNSSLLDLRSFGPSAEGACTAQSNGIPQDPDPDCPSSFDSNPSSDTRSHNQNPDSIP